MDPAADVLVFQEKAHTLFAISSNLRRHKIRIVIALAHSCKKFVMTLAPPSFLLSSLTPCDGIHHQAGKPIRNPERLALMHCTVIHIQEVVETKILDVEGKRVSGYCHYVITSRPN